MSIKRRQILRGATPPALLDAEFFQDTDTGDVIIGHNGGTLPVSNTGTLSTQIAALQTLKLDANDVSASADPNKVVRRDANGNIPGDITGAAPSAARLSTTRKITLTGGATGEANFNGSANAEIAVVVDPDQHEHKLTDLEDFPDLSLADGKILRVQGGAIVAGEESLPDNVYSQAEVDALLEQKAAAGHNHNDSY